jgi:hypothetical protein
MAIENENPIKDYTLTKEKPADDKREDRNETPVYLERFPLTDDEKDKLLLEVKAELDVIKQQRGDAHIDDRCDALDNQYNGVVQEDSRLQFNLNRNITKPIIDRVTNFVKRSYLDSDPIYSIAPRPEFMKEGGQDTCDAQQDFLDFKIDNLPFRSPIGKAIHSAVKKGDGWVKISHVIKTQSKRRAESYKGEPINVGVDPNTQQSIIRNKGLELFLSNWPKAREDYPGFVKDLEEGKEIEIMAAFTDTVFNDPLPQFVDIKNLYIRLTVEGVEGLKDTQLIAEKRDYTYWELKGLEKKEEFFDIDKLILKSKDTPDIKIENFANKNFLIWECTYYFSRKAGEEPVKIKCWIADEKWIVIGSNLYPYDELEYVQFYIHENDEAGLYHKGLAEFVTDTNVAQSALLNLALGGVYIRNTITPITKDPEVMNQFLEKRFAHGIPLEADPKSIGFLQSFMPQIDVNGMFNMLQFMKADGEDITQSSSLMSGAENPVDPQAPAQKTLMLLKQAGVGVDEYIKTCLPAFNQVAYVMLNIYYLMSKEGRKYELNSDRQVTGKDIFATITRQQLMARTNIQAQSYAYDFDNNDAAKKDYALYQILRGELLISRNPEAVYFLLKNIIKKWSPKWNNLVEKILPPLEKFKQEQTLMAIQAVAIYVKQKLDDAKVTGIAPEFDPNALLATINDLQAQIVTPANPDVVKAKEQANG